MLMINDQDDDALNRVNARNVLVVTLVVLVDVAIREVDEEQVQRMSARKKNSTLMMMLINGLTIR